MLTTAALCAINEMSPFVFQQQLSAGIQTKFCSSVVILASLTLVLVLSTHLVAQVEKDNHDDIVALRRLADSGKKGPDGNVIELTIGMKSRKKDLPTIVQHLKGLRSLERLTIGSCTDESIAEIKEFAELKELAIYSYDFTDLGMKVVSEMPSLEKLYLSASNVTEKGLENLKSLTQLRELTLFTLNATDETMRQLKECQHLKVIRLVEPKITDKGMEHLSGIATLKTLDLCTVYRIGGGFTGPDREAMWGPNVTNEGMKFIGKLDNLEFLALTNTRVDSGLEQIAKLKKLKTLILDKTDISDADLLHLLKLPALDELSLIDTKVTNDGVQQLAEIKSLRRLSLYGTGVTDVKELRKTIKDVWIDSK